MPSGRVSPRVSKSVTAPKAASSGLLVENSMNPSLNSSSPFLASSRKGKKSSSVVSPNSRIILVCISGSVKTPSGGVSIGGLTQIQFSGKLALKNVVSTFSYWVAAGRK